MGVILFVIALVFLIALFSDSGSRKERIVVNKKLISVFFSVGLVVFLIITIRNNDSFFFADSSELEQIGSALKFADSVGVFIMSCFVLVSISICGFFTSSEKLHKIWLKSLATAGIALIFVVAILAKFVF